jgi:hypothetical protein
MLVQARSRKPGILHTVAGLPWSGRRVFWGDDKHMNVRETIVEVGGEDGSIVLFQERETGGAWKFRMRTDESAIYYMLSEERSGWPWSCG